MSETQESIVHTPGPWEVFGIIGKPGLMHVRACAGVDRVGRKQYQEVPISQADARLIAAAPELLEACRLVLESIGQTDMAGAVLWINRGSGVHESASERLMDVIEKATGEVR